MSTYILLLLLLMARSAWSDLLAPECPSIENCRCTIPRVLHCTGSNPNFYEEVLESVYFLPNGTIELLEILLESNTSYVGDISTRIGQLSVPRLAVSSTSGLQGLDQSSFFSFRNQLNHLGMWYFEINICCLRNNWNWKK